MCWKKNDATKKIKPLVAENDIPCFKVVLCKPHGGFESPYQGFVYSINQTYYHAHDLKIIRSYDKMLCEVYEGFHSYHKNVKLYSDYYEKKFTIIFNNRLLDWFPMLLGNMLVVLKCIIPKGSKYLLNENGEYVSDALKPIDYCTFEKESVRKHESWK